MKIATGELAPGDQLPSVRGLAQQLTINPNTVAKAYAELTAEGWLESRQGLGLYVAHAAPAPSPTPSASGAWTKRSAASCTT